MPLELSLSSLSASASLGCYTALQLLCLCFLRSDVDPRQVGHSKAMVTFSGEPTLTLQPSFGYVLLVLVLIVVTCVPLTTSATQTVLAQPYHVRDQQRMLSA